jgi:hypothetical protein
MKITSVPGENVDLATNQMKSMMNILTTAGRPPDDAIELLLEYYQTSTNSKFNSVFHAMLNAYKLWGAGVAGDAHHITTTIIYQKAIGLYEELVNVKKWVKLQKTALAAVGEEKNSSEDGSSNSRTPQFPDLTQKKLDISKQVAAGAMTAEQAKIARKQIDKEKKARCKKTDKAANSVSPSALAAATPPGTPKNDKIREVVVDGIKLKGDFSRPSDADADKPRSFTKCDGGGSVELHWCRLHGYAGQWQNHKLQNCPKLGTSTSSNAGRGGGATAPPSSGIAESHVHWGDDPNSVASRMRASDRG